MLAKLTQTLRRPLVTAAAAQFSNEHDPKDHKRIHSSGSQSEAEWQRRQRGVDYTEDDDGFQVPEVFRENRHKFSQKPQDRDAFLRQITYRSGYIGTKEIEIILRDYLNLYGKQMSYQDLEEFDSQILGLENPSLYRYLVNQEPLEPEHNTRYVCELVLYV